MALPATNVRLGTLFGMLGVSCLALAAVPEIPLAAALPGGWAGACFAAVGIAYLRADAGLFGKRADGSLTPWRAVLLAPFLGMTWVVWTLQTWLSRENAQDEVAPGLWIGRRLRRQEKPPADVTLVVDMTAELVEPRALREAGAYLCVPSLDGSVPADEVFAGALSRVVEEKGGVLIHCAAGHGRSAALVAAVMVARGEAGSVEEAVRKMREKRPGVRLSAAQKAAVARALGGARGARG